MIPYFRLHSNKEELAALTEVCQTGSWAVGNAIPEVKTQLSELFFNRKVVLTSNGYSALFIGIKGLGISHQKIILPCISTCFAIGNAILASGNIPVFCDVGLQDGNCDREHVKKLVESENIRYIISPNHAGNLSDISYFKNDLGLVVIEDGCQSFFSSLSKPSQADLSVFSFYPTKGINGIDGGAIVTENNSLAEKAESFSYYNDQAHFEPRGERYNFRFLNLNAKVLQANLKHRTATIVALNTIKNRYDNILEGKINVYRLLNSKQDIAQRYVLCFKDNGLQETAVATFKTAGISLMPFFEWTCGEEKKLTFRNAGILVNTCFCIPYFESLSEAELDKITKTLTDVLS